MSEVGTGEVVIDVHGRLGRRVDKLNPRDHYPHKDFLKEAPSRHPLVRIPRGYIWGRQKLEEYDTVKRAGKEIKKEALAIKAFDEDIDFLDKAPIIACLVPFGENSSRVVVIDGHHRFKASGRVKIKDRDSGEERQYYDKVPIQIYTPDEMAELYNQSGMLTSTGEPYTGEKLTKSLHTQVAEVEQELEGILPARKRPANLNGITSVDQLVQEFAQHAA